jgi:hypothetical protein
MRQNRSNIDKVMEQSSTGRSEGRDNRVHEQTSFEKEIPIDQSVKLLKNSRQKN